jgi:hypothetical protein
MWSGIDTLNNPGKDKVKADCMGLGTACKEYQQGLDAQRRTNIILAATGGVAALTAVVGVFFTEWPGASHTGLVRSGLRPSGSAHPQLAPVLGIGQVGVEGTF